MTPATTAAATVTGERRKLHNKSLSTNRRHHLDGTAKVDGAPGAVISATGGGLALDPETRIDNVIEQVDHQVDNHEEEPDHYEVGRHHRDIGKGHRLDEHQPHARPLEHGLGDDREGDDRAEL